MKKVSKKTDFEDIPKTYSQLVQWFAPRPIHDSVSYGNTVEIADAMAPYGEHFTKDQEDYFELLSITIEEYEKECVEAPESSPVETLRYLLEENGMNATSLSRLLGTSVSVGARILRGERAITAQHAKTLGKHFSVSVSAFIK